MYRLPLLHLPALFLSAVLLAAPVSASTLTFLESSLPGGDAGQTLGTAAIVPDGTKTIQGTLNGADVDLYALMLAPGLFTARATSIFDLMLVLFDRDGRALVGNDDFFNQNPFVSYVVPDTGAETDQFYLAALPFASVQGPESADGLMWIAHIGGACGTPTAGALRCSKEVIGPTGPGAAGTLTGWTLIDPSETTQRPYTITLNRPTGPAPIPLPGALPLLLGAIGALVMIRRRSRIDA